MGKKALRRKKIMKKKAAPKQAAKEESHSEHSDSEHSDSEHSGSDRSESDSDYSDRSKTPTSSSKCSGSSDEDDAKHYKKGGYHPVILGQVYASRYTVLCKLGSGAFSTVWLCNDEQNNGSLVAMKICKSSKSVSEQAMDEIKLLECLNKKVDNSVLDADVNKENVVMYTVDENNTKVRSSEVVVTTTEAISVPSTTDDNNCKILSEEDKKDMTNKLEDVVEKSEKNTTASNSGSSAEQNSESCSISTSNTYCTKLLNHFWHTGPNGKHKCLIFDVLGENLLALVKHTDYRGLPISWVKRIAIDTLKGLSWMHKNSVIHTDIKLENVLIARHDMDLVKKEANEVLDALKRSRKQIEDAEIAARKQDGGDGSLSKAQKKRMKKKQKKLLEKQEVDNVQGIEHPLIPHEERVQIPAPPQRQKYRLESLALEDLQCTITDFGNGCWTYKHFTNDIQTRQYRAPEVLIGQEYDETTDMWSLACMIFELMTGDFLFDPKSTKKWTTDEDQMALMIELIGEHPPKEWLMAGERAKEFFSNDGKLKRIKTLRMWSLEDVLVEKYYMEEGEAQRFSDFLMGMLTWEPNTRSSADSALLHPWLWEPTNEDNKCVNGEESSSESEEEEDEYSDSDDGQNNRKKRMQNLKEALMREPFMDEIQHKNIEVKSDSSHEEEDDGVRGDVEEDDDDGCSHDEFSDVVSDVEKASPALGPSPSKSSRAPHGKREKAPIRKNKASDSNESVESVKEKEMKRPADIFAEHEATSDSKEAVESLNEKMSELKLEKDIFAEHEVEQVDLDVLNEMKNQI